MYSCVCVCVCVWIQILDGGSLYIADVGLQHVGNYSCHDERWPDVSQTHVVDVHGLLACRHTDHIKQAYSIITAALAASSCRYHVLIN